MRRTRSVVVERISGDDRHRGPDDLIVEEPLEIRLDGHLVATTMRTPGHDVELAVGFCHTEGLLEGAHVRGARHSGDGSGGAYNVIDVGTGGAAPPPTPRLGNVTAACGWCGRAAIAELGDRLGPLVAVPAAVALTLAKVVEQIRAAQPLFETTGAAHGAAAFGPDGVLGPTREDIGRHNAVDKVIGRLLLDAEPPPIGDGLVVTGRASFEMVHKAWSAGFGTLVAVSGPSALAVEAARRAGMNLVGFARDDRLNVYAGEVR